MIVIIVFGGLYWGPLIWETTLYRGQKRNYELPYQEFNLYRVHVEKLPMTSCGSLRSVFLKHL